ncbi:MAG: hypothetical protein HFE63_06425 [Clostridiales bacterium]|nr:hypothetical protein [Clostridiales bacterium]
MKNCKKCSENSMSALKLILIITGSIVAAVGILCMIMKLCKKKHCLKPVECCCGHDEDTVDSWDIDEDVLDDLILDDDDCGCVECSNPECGSCGVAAEEAAEASEPAGENE